MPKGPFPSICPSSSTGEKKGIPIIVGERWISWLCCNFVGAIVGVSTIFVDLFDP